MSRPYYGQTSEWCTTELAKWQAAHSALSTGKSYEVQSGGTTRRLDRFSDLELVRETMFALKEEIDLLASTSRPRVSYPKFLDT